MDEYRAATEIHARETIVQERQAGAVQPH